jgi:MFS family permease
VINAEHRQLWQTTVSDALPQVGTEFNPPHSAFLSLALIAGLVVGAGFWGFGADLIGRRLVFNTTLLIAGVFGIAAGGANSFVSCAVLCSFIGFGVGGNRKPIRFNSWFERLSLSSAC